MIHGRPHRLILLSAAVLLVALLTPTSLPAIEDPYNEIGAFGGIGFCDKAMVDSDDATIPGPVFGVRWRHSIYDPMSWSVWASIAPKYNGKLAFGDWSETQISTSLDWYFSRRERYAWYVSPGLGFMQLKPDTGDTVSRPIGTLGIGQKIYPGDPGANIWWEFHLDPAAGSSGLNGSGIIQIKLVGGASWGFGGNGKDTDGDGVPDRKDKCPETPAGATVDGTGCPKDSDGDGALDGLDKCPDTPDGWPVDESGCPLDTDADGVPDGGDACAATPKGAKVDAKGCPTDADKDGVFDGLDACPETPAGAKVDVKGCPIDSDGDRVWDGLDKCPDTPAGKQVDADGCPLPEKAEPLFTPEKKTLVLEGVNFEHDRSTLTPGSTTILDTVAASLKDWPEVKVEIGGHTDSLGSNAYNEKLSESRAAAVRDYLATAGVAAAQMTVKGYGESTPIADNNTEEGRAKNRRVELKKLE